MREINVLMIAPRMSSSNPLEELGICSIAALLRREGYKVNLKALVKGDEDYDAIKKNNPDIIGLTVYNQTINFVYDICKKLKKISPSAFIVVGGYTPTYYPNKILNECMEIDFAIIGEGELAFLELVRSVDNQSDHKKIKGLAYRENNTVITNDKHEPIENLDDLPQVSRDLLSQNRWKPALISTSRGCTKDCLFCCAKDFWKSQNEYRWRTRSINNVCDEIEYICNELKINEFWIIDASFEDPGFNEERLRGFAEEVIRRKLFISYFVFFRTLFYKNANENLMNLLVKSGLCEVFLGIESANKADLNLFDKGASVEDNIAAIDFFKTYDIYTEIGFINFNPYSTFDGLNENAEFLKKYRLACFFRNLTFLGLYRGSRFYERVKADGLLSNSNITDFYCYHYKDKRIEVLAKFLQGYSNSLKKENNIICRFFTLERYFDDRLAHFKRHFNYRSDEERFDLINKHQKNLELILSDINNKVTEWFNKLLFIAEHDWDYYTAKKITDNMLNIEYATDILNKFENERLSFLKYVLRIDEKSVVYLS